ncbi:MAG TPA: hypothetical protein VFP32_01055 [Candidatus Saccharimonadales bacterium]|nr:hypothetical protein [Candidatus Saccharimonadales bacterium]
MAKFLPIFFAAKQTCTPGGGKLFGIPHWWQYLPGQLDATGRCVPDLTNDAGKFNLMSVWAIGLAVIDMLLFLAGIAAVGSIIFAGVSYITAAGDSAKVTSARKRIQNSLIGLAIVFIASAAVSYIGNTLTN